MKFPFLQGDKNKDQVMMIPLDKIKPNPYQPRTDFNEEEIEELADSIKTYGVIQPVTLRPRGDIYELIVGERRLRASRRLGLKEIPAVVKDFSDQEVAEIALVENLQRKNLNFLEEAEAYQKLLKNFALTQSELAERIGKSQSTIANKLRLLNLHTDVRKHFNSDLISERHARALLKLKDKNKQIEVIKKVKEKELTVKETEKLVNDLLSKDSQKRKVITVCKDLRVFTNTLKKTIKEMQVAGLKVEVDKEEDNRYIEYRIRLPKN